ncbi:hypothetical protein [Streptomyces europaeiscabiei]|uniref:hypothetical protein n=1 Tax=Streptomyces europaeiscabiei TaxID=146819 RepID=UPI0038F6DADB
MPHRLHPAQLAPAALLIVAAIAGCSASASPAPDRPDPALRATTATRLSHTLPQDPVPMVLPATGADTRLTVGLGAFGQTVSAAVTARCTHDAGRPRPQGPPPMFVRLGALPDLDLLERDGFNSGPAPDLPSVLRATANSAEPDAASADGSGGDSDAVVSRCASAGTTAVRSLDALFSPLQSRWWDELDALGNRPQVRRALAKVPACLEHRHDLRVNSEDDFFSLVDSRLAEYADDATAFAREDRELAGAYADCMRPVEAVREPLREKLREQFVSENAREIAALRSKLGPSVEELEKRHGVRISFPTP